MWSALAAIKKRLTLSITVAMGAGLALGWFWQATPLMAKVVLSKPMVLLELLPVLVTFLATAFALASVEGRFFKRGDGVALVVAGALIVQVQGAALYLKITDKVFGRPAEVVSA